jgi:hypothetical protein
LIEPIDYEQQDPIPVGECAYCDEDVMPWDYYYKFDEDVVHDECVISYIQKFKVYGGIE